MFTIKSIKYNKQNEGSCAFFQMLKNAILCLWENVLLVLEVEIWKIKFDVETLT